MKDKIDYVNNPFECSLGTPSSRQNPQEGIFLAHVWLFSKPLAPQWKTLFAGWLAGFDQSTKKVQIAGANHPQAIALTSHPRRMSIFIGTSFASPAAHPS